MKNQNRVRFNGSAVPFWKQEDGNTAKSAGVEEVVHMLDSFPSGKRKVALRLLALLSDHAMGIANQSNIVWDCLPELLSWRRNDKFRLARAFRKNAEIFHSALRVDLAKRFEYWAERIHMIALYSKHPELMRPLIKSCMPAASQNN